MRERSRLENFFAQLALAAVMAAIILVAVEYWRSWKSEHDMAAPPRGTAVAYPIAAVQAGSSLSSAGGFVNGASRVPMSEVDRAAEARLEAQLRAAADALGDANERVRILGEERDALMAERDALLAAGSSVEQSVAEQASHAQALERALAQRESELAAITEHMASLEVERDDLARRLGQAETNVGERVSVLERTILARDAELATAEARIAELTRATQLAAAGGSGDQCRYGRRASETCARAGRRCFATTPQVSEHGRSGDHEWNGDASGRQNIERSRQFTHRPDRIDRDDGRRCCGLQCRRLCAGQPHMAKPGREWLAAGPVPFGLTSL